MSDYNVKELEDFINNKLNSISNTNDIWKLRYLLLHSIFMYFQYAVAQVHIQEENIEKMETDPHNEDCLLKRISSGINAYTNIRTCLEMTRELINELPDNKQNHGFKKFRDVNKTWVTDLIDKRNFVSVHPYRKIIEAVIVWKPRAMDSNGLISFPVTMDPKNTKIDLYPRVDLEKLRKYLCELIVHLEKGWGGIPASVKT